MNMVLRLVLLVIFLSGCSHVVTLKPGYVWHTVWSVNRPGVNVDINVRKENSCNESSVAQATELRLIRLSHFMDLSGFPNTRADSEGFYSKTEHSGVPLRLLDSGPLDISQNGAIYQLRITKGMALISRTKEECGYLVIKILPGKENQNE